MWIKVRSKNREIEIALICVELEDERDEIKD